MFDSMVVVVVFCTCCMFDRMVVVVVFCTCCMFDRMVVVVVFCTCCMFDRMVVVVFWYMLYVSGVETSFRWHLRTGFTTVVTDNSRGQADVVPVHSG